MPEEKTDNWDIIDAVILVKQLKEITFRYDDGLITQEEAFSELCKLISDAK